MRPWVTPKSSVFPAPAGMNRIMNIILPRDTRVPRARGDEPQEFVKAAANLAVFPAPAGMNRG